MSLAILPVLAYVLGSTAPTADQPVVLHGLTAQVALSEVLGDAEAIDEITVRGATIRFAIMRGGAPLALVAQTNRRGAIISLAIEQRSREATGGNLTWLAGELADTVAITQLLPGANGAITVVASDARRWTITPNLPATTNAGPAARWEATWNQ